MRYAFEAQYEEILHQSNMHFKLISFFPTERNTCICIAYISSKPEGKVQSYAKHVQLNIVILFRYFEFKSAFDKVRRETTCLLISF